MDSFLEVIMQYGLDTIIIAIVTTVLTGILKLPIKKLAQKLTDSHVITRFITFLPVIIGFGMTVLGNFLLSGNIPFGEQSFYLQWISAASLSFTIYAFWEKFIPSKKKTFTESEIKENLEFLQQVRKAIEDKGNVENSVRDSGEETPVQAVVEKQDDSVTIPTGSEVAAVNSAKRIILTGGKNVKATKE